MSAQTDGRLVHTENTQNEGYQAPLVGFLVVYADSTCQALPHSILLDDYLYFDLAGPEDACLDFVEQIPAKMAAAFGAPEEDFRQINDIFSARQTGYGTYGGLLFLGAFFSILFLAVAVLMLYFKQITEGNEDRERFALLQKVGMDQTQVHRVINSQVLWVFFLPLGATLLHMVFASRILSRMLGAFNMSDFAGHYLRRVCLPGLCPAVLDRLPAHRPGVLPDRPVGYGGSPMLKTHLPYLFLLLGVFLLFAVLLPKALDTVGQDHLLAFYSQAVEQAGALALAPPEETPGILERDPDGYTGSYQASLSGYTGQLTLFGGTSIEPETEALSLHSQIQGQNGSAQLLYQMGSGAPEILLSDSGEYTGQLTAPAGSCYLTLDLQDFSGDISITVQPLEECAIM